ncbi:lipase maturation factor 2-like isoform X2 [Tubulanus polymorphus]|uniref:lipase maturation factor 2-like isoform X2 n=1 Tax=Tubulanus polymorphus TaxID=672921 RepID=UPI003DA35F01
MSSYHLTRDLYLWAMSVVYLFAFASLYVQIPGLYGENGILPVHLKVPKPPKDFNDFMQNHPTLMSLMPKLGLEPETGMDLLCLIGILFSFIMLIAKSFRECVGFVILWVLYFSLYQVGQTFLYFQWDSLILEAGFLTILIAPMNLKLGRFSCSYYHHHDSITMWLVKWLLFRLMFASGVVKLTSGCPTWWGLTALLHHYESQCIPTPLAWYAHQFPEWFQKLGVAIVFVIEIIVPFLFFVPFRSLRIFSFYAQMLLQVMIILTGNYNFFNFLTMALCISLLDDDYLFSLKKRRKVTFREGIDSIPVVGFLVRLFTKVTVLAVIIYIIYSTIKYFNLTLNKQNWQIESKIGFTRKEFDNWLEKAVPVTIYVGIASLGLEVLTAIYRSLRERGLPKKFSALLGTLLFSALAGMMFGVSLVPHARLANKMNLKKWPQVKTWYETTRPFHITSGYGLFRRMTGVGGRPELVIEGSNSLQGPWHEYDFLYKPGNTSVMPPIVAPHQPRLDWQMWFAALGNYQHNPWFINLVYRLLTGQKEVIELLEKNPFPNKPPIYMKATLYKYHYTRYDRQHKWHSQVDWWVREKESDYIPILTKDEPTMLQYLRHEKIIQDEPRRKFSANLLSVGVKHIRSHVGQMDGFLFIGVLVITSVLITILDRLSRGWR